MVNLFTGSISTKRLRTPALDRLSTVSSAENFSFLIETLRVSPFDFKHFASHCSAVLSYFLLSQGAFRRGNTFGLTFY